MTVNGFDKAGRVQRKVIPQQIPELQPNQFAKSLGLAPIVTWLWCALAIWTTPQLPKRYRLAPASKLINSVALLAKKSKCWLWLAVDSIFGKVLGFVCGRRTIKTGRVFWQQIKHLLTTGYGTDMLKSYENFIPHAKHYAGKTFTTQIESLNCRLRHYLARLHRKTLCYSKSKTMWEVSLKLLIH